MIFDNIEFHNVVEFEPCDEGCRMWRVPKHVREHLNPSAAKQTSHYGTGVELRFKLKGDFATIYLASEPVLEAPIAHVFYGSIQGGWQNSSRAILTEKTAVHIEKPKNMEFLKKLSKEQNFPFNPEVVRIILPYTTIFYLGVDGEVEPPTASELPAKTYLAYGSSITHGSLSLIGPYTYPFRLSQKLGCDYINYGFAGSAFMEKEMAEYLVSRKDWDFATVEMGINMLENDIEVFERNVDTFTKILSEDSRPVYATSIYGFNAPNLQENGRKFRAIVEKYAKERLTFIDGLKLLNNPAYISQDMIHPTTEGIEQIVDGWYQILANKQINR